MGSVLFAGGRLESLTVLSGSPYDYTDNSSRWDASYSDAALNVNNGVVSHKLFDASMGATTVEVGGTFFYHFTGWTYAFNAGAFWQLLNSAGVPWLRLYGFQDTSNIALQYYDGSAWQNLGPLLSYTGVHNYDVVVYLGAGGAYTASLYVDQSLTAATGDISTTVASGTPNAAEVRLAGNAPYFSQLLATVDQSTIGAHVKTARATGAGSYQQWDGTYTDVNEPGDNDTTANQATSSGLKQTYPMGSVTVPEGYGIRGVFHWLRAKNDGGDPSNLRTLMIGAGGEHQGDANLPGIGLGYAPVGARYDTNPDTGELWTAAEWNAPIQLGFTSFA